MKNKILNIAKTIALPIITLIVMEILVYSLKQKHIISTMLDLKTIIRQAGIVCTMAFALSFNLSSGRFDLSLGAQRLVGTIIGGTIAKMLGLSGIWLLLFALLFGLLFGFLTGLVFIIMRVPPMVLGCGIGLIWEVVAFNFTNGKGLNLYGMKGNEILNDTFFTIFVMIAIALFVSVLMNSTKFGYQTRAIQGNQIVAQNSGINIFKNAVICYTLAGGLACVAGMIDTAYTTQMLTTLGLASSASGLVGMFAMMLGSYIGQWTNQAFGTICAALSVKILSYGLSLLEFSEPNTNVANNTLFVLFLIFLANKHLIKYHKAKKARKHLAQQTKLNSNLA